jgi:hypothetical protein
MSAVRTNLTADDLPDDLGPRRSAIEPSVPVGFNGHGEAVNVRRAHGLPNAELSDALVAMMTGSPSRWTSNVPIFWSTTMASSRRDGRSGPSHRIVVEHGAAAAWAALASGAYVPESDDRVVVLLPGANTSIEV